VKSAVDGGSDEKVERQKAAVIKLFLVSDEGGTLKIEEKKAGPLKKSDLGSQVGQHQQSPAAHIGSARLL